MKIIINYAGEDIEPYSLELELEENNIPKTVESWQKLALEKANPGNTSFIIKSLKFPEISSSNSMEVNVVLHKPIDLFASVPPELLPLITEYLDNPTDYIGFANQTSKQLTQRIKAAEFSQNIKKLLGQIDSWIKEDVDTKRFYAWIKVFRDKFVSIYNELPLPRSAEHTALFGLITDDIKTLDLEELDATAKIIDENYPAVAASLNAMRAFLVWSQNRTATLDQKWRNTSVTRYCNLRGVNLEGKYPECKDLSDVNLSGVNLSGVCLISACLNDANLAGTNLAGANLHHAKFVDSDLRGANLAGAKLYYANFAYSDLRGANLAGTYIDSGNLEGTNLEGANLTGVKFSHRISLKVCNLVGAKVCHVEWTDEQLLTVKQSTLEILQAAIKAAASYTDLKKIYNKNCQEDHVFDVKQNLQLDNLFSFFSDNPKLTNHRKEFNEAICNRIYELLESSITTEDEKSLLIELQHTINADYVASVSSSSAPSLKRLQSN